jgi:hypothetical protein
MDRSFLPEKPKRENEEEEKEEATAARTFSFPPSPNLFPRWEYL